MAGSIVRVGDVQRVNTDPVGFQYATSVTTLTDGGWLVTWTALDQSFNYLGIYQQRYDENGDTVGPETLVNTYTTDSQSNPSVAALSDGGWLVTWTSRVGTGHDASDEIHQQRFGMDGKAVGPETLVNTFEQGTQRYPSVTALKEGGWVVTWESVFERGIYQQRYDEDGVAVGPEIWVSPPASTILHSRT
jgi:hypothetical protein